PPLTTPLFPYTTLFRSDDAMKQGAVVKAVLDVADKIFHRFGCFFGVQFDNNVASRSNQFDAGGRTHGFTLLRGSGSPGEVACCRDRKSTRLNSSHVSIS